MRTATLCLCLTALLAALWQVLPPPASAQLAAAQGENWNANPDIAIVPNTNPDPLPCPPEPPEDPDRDLVVTGGPEVQLTNFHRYSWSPRIAVWDDAVYVVWKTEDVASAERIFSRSSYDRGSTWRNWVFVATKGNVQSCHPAIAAWGNSVYAVLRGAGVDVQFTTSINSGQSWGSPPIMLINDGWNPAIAVWDHYVNVVAQVSTIPGGIVCHRLSTDGGHNFSPVDTLALIPMAGGSIQPMRLCAYQNYVYTAYSYYWDSTNTQEIFFQRSTDYGHSFEPFVMISTPGMSHSQWPSLASTENGDVYLAWMDYKYSPYGSTGDILLRRSPDFGEHWEEEIIATNDHLARADAIAARDSQVHVIYEKDYPSGFPYDEMDIAYRYSDNLGQSWSAESWVCQAHDMSQGPDLVQLGDTLHAVWSDDRPYGNQIYYRRAAISQQIQSVAKSSPPENSWLSISPNPFNSALSLQITIDKPTDISITIHNIQGKEVKRLHHGNLAPGNHQFVWEGKDDRGLPVATGVYLAVLKANGRAVSCQKVLYLK